jgi:hypothetical protein
VLLESGAAGLEEAVGAGEVCLVTASIWPPNLSALNLHARRDETRARSAAD